MNQHQDYDKIVKENIKKSQNAILQHICGVFITEWEELPRDVPRTIERRGDWLKIGKTPLTGERKLYHLEFQSYNDEKMALRMLLFWALYTDLYGFPVEQYVIYLGSGTSTMPQGLTADCVNYNVKVLSINTIDYELFLHSEKPEAIIWTILADFKKEENEAIVEKILLLLCDKVKNRRQLNKYIYQLELLGNLRKLQPIIAKKITDMSIHYDLKEDLRYQQGWSEGIAEGKAEGKAEGETKGYHVSTQIIKLYLKGVATAEIVERLGLDTETVQRVIAELEAE